MSRLARVSALYVRADGPYPSRVEDWWDGSPGRDARDYGGARPVVAHPPLRQVVSTLVVGAAENRGAIPLLAERLFEQFLAAARNPSGQNHIDSEVTISFEPTTGDDTQPG